jgi:hypothetical protein
VMLVVGGDIADAGVQPDGVVFDPHSVQLWGELAGVADAFQARSLALDVAERERPTNVFSSYPTRTLTCSRVSPIPEHTVSHLSYSSWRRIQTCHSSPSSRPFSARSRIG